MGGLRKELPITYWTFLIGALAIAGVPLLSGFFCKDEILYQTFSTGHPVLWAIGAVTSLLTAFYMFRLVFLTFHGERAAAHGGTAPHGHGHAAARAWRARPRRPPCRRPPARRAAGDGDPADHAGARLGARRLRRRRRTPSAASNRIDGFLESIVPSGLRRGGSHGPLEPRRDRDGAPGDGAATRQRARACRHGGRSRAHAQTELTLMGVSSAIALLGIGIAA